METEGDRFDEEINRVKINTVASKTPMIAAKVSVKKKGMIIKKELNAIPDTGAEISIAGRDFV